MRIQINKLGRTPSEDSKTYFLLAYYCPNCCSELFGFWHHTDRLWDDCQKEQSALMELKRCPVCSKMLVKKRGYYMHTQEYSAKATYAPTWGSPNTSANLKDCYNDFFNTHYSGSANTKTAKDYWESRRNGTFQANCCCSFKEPGEMFIEMRKIRKNMARQEAEHLTNRIQADYKHMYSGKSDGIDLRFMSKLSAARIAEIHASREKLKEYLHSILKTETDIYFLSQYLTQLYVKRSENAALAGKNKFKTAAAIRAEILDAEAELANWTKQVKLYTEDLDNAQNTKIPLLQFQWPHKPIPPVLEKPGLFNRNRVLAQNNALTAQYEQELATYNQKMADCQEKKRRIEQEYREKVNAAVRKARADLNSAQSNMKAAETQVDRLRMTADIRIQSGAVMVSPSDAIVTMLDKEIDNAKAMLKEMYGCRTWLWAQNIVYEKFRNLEAISVLYEYLLSGRCYSLEGPHGAYNLYMTEHHNHLVEAKLSRIEDSLEQICSSLEDVKESQHFLYEALQNTNSKLNTLNRSMDQTFASIQSIEASTLDTNDYLDKIARSSHATAFNSEILRYYAILNTDLRRVYNLM